MTRDVVSGDIDNPQGCCAGSLPDVDRAREIIAGKRKTIGPRYDAYLEQVGGLLRQNFPRTFETMTDENLKNFIAVVDISGGPSRGQMKRLQEYCDGCGWCCSKTSRIVVI